MASMVEREDGKEALAGKVAVEEDGSPGKAEDTMAIHPTPPGSRDGEWDIEEVLWDMEGHSSEDCLPLS